MLPLEADANSRWQGRRMHGLTSILYCVVAHCCLYRVVNLD